MARHEDGEDITDQIPGAAEAGLIVELIQDDDVMSFNPRDDDGNATLYTRDRDYTDYDERDAKNAYIEIGDYVVYDQQELDDGDAQGGAFEWDWSDDWNETAKRLKEFGCEVVLVMRRGDGGMESMGIDDDYAKSACGVLYLTPMQIRERFMIDEDRDIPDEQRTLAYNSLHDEINEYSDWATGEVYGYVISRSVRGRKAEEVDSCWGHIGHKWAVEAATEAAKYWIENPPDADDHRRIENTTDVIEVYRQKVGSDDCLLVDLLADLMHWAEHVGEDFTDALEQAASHYKDESGNDVL